MCPCLKPILEKFVQTFERTLTLPNVQAQMEKAGVLPTFMGPNEFADFIDDQYKFFMDLAKETGK
jgi:tripartite-type tricarboxylate transporter receptor subunit TctC